MSPSLSASAPRRYVVVAGDPDSCDLILSVLPPEPGDVECVLLGCDAAAVDAYPPGLPVARVSVAPAAAFDSPPDGVGPTLLTLLREPSVVLLDSSQAARDLAGWLTVRAGARLAWAVERLEAMPAQGIRVTRVVNGGDARLLQEFTTATLVVLLTRSSTPASTAGPRGRPKVTTLAVEVGRAAPTRRLGNGATTLATGLSGARIVVAVGRGIGGPAQLGLFRALAHALGAALGASRVVVDQGWLSFAHQIGQTGAVVAPDLYLGFGVSGAVQHLVGMRDSRTVVAVNTDRHAPICEIADLVIEGDAVEVARELLDQISNERT